MVIYYFYECGRSLRSLLKIGRMKFLNPRYENLAFALNYLLLEYSSSIICFFELSSDFVIPYLIEVMLVKIRCHAQMQC